MNRYRIWLLRALPVVLGLCLWPSTQAHAAEADVYCGTGTPGPGYWQPASATNPCPVNATVSASISGFAPATTGTPIAVTTGGVSGTLPAGTVVVVSNVGATNGAYCKLGASATTSDQLIPPNSWFAFTVGAATQLTCITSTSTTTVNMVGGSGLPTGSGGGGGGGSTSFIALTSTNLSSTISVTNTFQSIQVSTVGRKGCTVQNNGNNTMWVFFGAIGSATAVTSFQLLPGTAISCAVGGLGVLTDQVSITGTATDAFTANFQ